MPRAALIVEYRRAGVCPAEATPLVRFDLRELRAALVVEVQRLHSCRRKLPVIERIFFAVFDLIDVVVRLFHSFMGLFGLVSEQASAEKAERIRLHEEWRRLEEERSPAALLKWLDSQDAESVIVDRDKWELAWMFYRAIPGPPSLRFPDQDDETGTLQFLGAHCSECRVTYAPRDLSMQHWGYDRGILAAGQGRRLVCPNQHVVLEVLDWQS